MEYEKRANQLIDFINKAVTPYHAVSEVGNMLEASGYQKLEWKEEWSITSSGKYYVTPYESSCFAFQIGRNFEFGQGFKILSAHTDQPCFRIKPSPEMVFSNYLKINTEVYGGPILSTWLDRPLSIAGRVALRSSDVFHPEMKPINIEKSILTIPNLAIHMNREVNKGVELNRQVDMLPILGMMNDTLNANNFFIDYLANYLEIDPKDILDFDLFLYAREQGEMIGIHDEFISAPRLDDLSMVFAATQALIETDAKRDIHVVALFDNEEIGSRSKQGADSNLLTFILERIFYSLNRDTKDFYKSLATSFMISADAAHAVHPNRAEKHDPTNRPILNKGLVIKMNGNQRYCTDSEAIGVFQQLCDLKEIPYQKYVNRSDEVGGSTLGPIASAYLPIRGIDVGTPMLAMHSARELVGTKDQGYMTEAFIAFFDEQGNL